MNANHHRGFSLVELLIVLGVAALLLGQTIPAAHRVRSDAQRIECMSKVGQIARAGLVYAAQDPDESSVPIGQGDLRPEAIYNHYSYGGKSGWGVNMPVGQELRYSDFSGVRHMDAGKRPLNFILYKDFPIVDAAPGSESRADWSRDARLDFDIYHCPADDGFPGLHHGGWKMINNSSYHFYGTSYVPNVLHVRAPWNTEVYSNSPYARPLSSIVNPQKTLLYMENAARFAMFAPNTDEFDQSGCYWWSGVYLQVAAHQMVAHGHHGQDWHFNTAAVDGHAMYVRMKGHGRIPEPPGMPPFGFSYDCIFVRGLDWQRDTLPAPLVEVDKTAFSNNAGPFVMDGYSLYGIVK